jgi:hypothetical protein
MHPSLGETYRLKPPIELTAGECFYQLLAMGFKTYDERRYPRREIARYRQSSRVI